MDIQWNDFLSQFLTLVIIGVIPIIAHYVVQYLKAQSKRIESWITENIPSDELFELQKVARMVVKAAEQAGMAGLVKEKKAYAVQIAQEWLSSHGMEMDISAIDAAIEAAVYEEFKRDLSKTEQE